jgi:hypothetical protein
LPFFSITLALLVCSCASSRFTHEDWSEEAARREAQADIATGGIKIYYGGTIAAGPLGVLPEQAALIRDLPKKWFPTGCNVRYASEGIGYGRAYNAEILRFLADASKSQR